VTDLALKVGGKKYSGWTTVQITRSMEQIAHSFSVSYVDKMLPEAEPLSIKEGDAVKVSIEDDDVIDGWVDISDISYDDASHRAYVSGRSKACDLIDCSVIHSPGSWIDRDLMQIASELCAPYSIGVVAEADIGEKLKYFAIQEGQTVFDVLNQLARIRGLIIISDAGNNIIFTRAGTEKIKTKLELGKNIKRGNRTGNITDRYSQYIVKGQTPGNDEWNGVKAAQQTATVSDDTVSRYRPLIIQAEDTMTGSEVEKRATWERNTRMGKSQKLKYVYLMSWHHAAGLWEPNKLVSIKDDFVGINDELIIVSVNYMLNEQGKSTEIELTRKEAFDVLELPAPKKKNKWGLF
jgi:prophage tail gpP-like protein